MSLQAGSSSKPGNGYPKPELSQLCPDPWPACPSSLRLCAKAVRISEAQLTVIFFCALWLGELKTKESPTTNCTCDVILKILKEYEDMTLATVEEGCSNKAKLWASPAKLNRNPSKSARPHGWCEDRSQAFASNRRAGDGGR